MDSKNGIDGIYIIKYVLIFFLILSIAVFYEAKNKSEYMNPMETIQIKQFFNEFNNSIQKENYIHKYNSKALKQLKTKIKNNLKYQLTNIVKKNKIYELHISEQENNDKLYILKFFLKQNNHILYTQQNNDEFKIILIK